MPELREEARERMSVTREQPATLADFNEYLDEVVNGGQTLRVTDELVEVPVIARWGVTVQAVDREVRIAVQGMTAGRHLDVVIEDVDVTAALA